MCPPPHTHTPSLWFCIKTVHPQILYISDNDIILPPQLTFIAVNDAPILLYVTNESARSSPAPVLTGETVQSFRYTEDDPAINVGRNIYLRDVDGDIMSATIRLEG